MLGIAVVLVIAMIGLGFVLNHLIARIAFVELALTYGRALPTDSRVQASADDTAASSVPPVDALFEPAVAAAVLPADAITLFVSSSCTTCVRLVDDLADPAIKFERPLHLYFESDAPIVARSGIIHERQSDFIDRLHVPALPYAVISVDGQAAAHGAVAEAARLDNLLALAGVDDRLPAHLVAQP